MEFANLLSTSSLQKHWQVRCWRRIHCAGRMSLRTQSALSILAIAGELTSTERDPSWLEAHWTTTFTWLNSSIATGDAQMAAAPNTPSTVRPTLASCTSSTGILQNTSRSRKPLVIPMAWVMKQIEIYCDFSSLMLILALFSIYSCTWSVHESKDIVRFHNAFHC